MVKGRGKIGAQRRESISKAARLTRAERVASRGEAEDREAERQREAQETKSEEQRVAEEQRQQFLDEPVEIGGQTFRRRDVQRAQSMLKRQLETGKPPIVANQEERIAFRAFQAIVREGGPDLKRDIQKAIGTRIAAKEAGFKSVKEFVAVKGVTKAGLTEREQALTMGKSLEQFRKDKATERRVDLPAPTVIGKEGKVIKFPEIRTKEGAIVKFTQPTLAGLFTFKPSAQIEAEKRAIARDIPLKDLFKISPPRAVLRSSEILIEKLEEKFISKFRKRPLTKAEREEVGSFVGPALIFAATPSQIFTTSTQILKAATEVKDVAVVGVSQRLKGGKIETQIKFVTSKGERGVAKGITKVRQLEKFSLGKTFSKGVVETGRRLRVPTGRITPVIKKFAGAEVTVSRQAGKSFIQVGGGVVGKVTKRGLKDISKFASVSTGITKQQATIFIGGVKAQTGGLRVAGIIKQVSRKPTGITIIGKGATSVSKTIVKQALQSTQNIAAAAVKPAVTTLPKLAVLPTVAQLLGPVTTKIRTPRVRTPKVTQISLPAQRQLPKVSVGPFLEKQLPKVGAKEKVSLRISSKAAQLIKQETLTLQRPALEVAQITPQAIKPKLIFAVPLVTLTTRRGVTTTPFKIPRIPKIAKIPALSTAPNVRELGRGGGGFFVQTRRKGKWKNVAKQRFTRSGGLSFGAEVTDRSLAASFRIIGAPKGKKRPIDWANYLGLHGNKFRPHKIRKGSRIDLGFTGAIEKKSFRLDTVGEVNKIQAAKLAAKLLGRTRRKKRQQNFISPAFLEPTLPKLNFKGIPA